MMPFATTERQLLQSGDRAGAVAPNAQFPIPNAQFLIPNVPCPN